MMWDPASLSDAVLCLVEGALRVQGCAKPDKRYVSVGTISYDGCRQLTAGPNGRIYRSVSFPTETTDLELCYAGEVVVPMAVVWTVCSPTTAPGRMQLPTDAQLDDASGVALHDAGVIWNALSGELPDDEWERAGLSQEFIGPQGGIVGIVTRMLIGVGAETWCV